MYRIAKILAIILGVVGLVIWVMIARDENPAGSGMVDLMINLGYYMTIITAVVTFAFAVWQLITHPDKLKKALISLGAFAVVLVIAYAVLASGTNINLDSLAQRGIVVDEGTSKMVGAGLWAFYLLALIAVLSMVFAGVKKILNN
ncbi:hypothetical protein E7Z59_01505 [Robertkochia marina]|uniref:Uncharacterized protein n=1 Tax=Robertkochia marina TaxID=1227945 RepID=A0A4S3M1Q2_9FLAO|nr:hypothetical protein [Robertkochia marina]THD69034.1 hypothetical protein E7Z59_01505 [Robertkochia marina]TRZ44857.1 hypothetical protein D3A96_07470 [Robertkochia marina]